MITNSLRRKFVKDQGLPISVIDGEMFAYFLGLYDPIYNCIAKYAEFCECVKLCGGEEGYSSHIFHFVEDMMNAISSTVAYKEMNNKKVVIEYTPIVKVNSTDIYHKSFSDRKMISIDLRSANFNALRYVAEDAVLGCATYDELASKFTTHKYIRDNKQLRQVVFGKLNPGKLIGIQKIMLNMICDNIMTEYPYFELSLMGSDEVIVTSYGDLEPYEAYLRVTDCIPPSVDFFNAQIFELQQVHYERHYFIRKPWVLSEDGKLLEYGQFVFKSVPGVFFPQVYKNFFGLDLNDNDLMFLYEGQASKFLKGIY